MHDLNAGLREALSAITQALAMILFTGLGSVDAFQLAEWFRPATTSTLTASASQVPVSASTSGGSPLLEARTAKHSSLRISEYCLPAAVRNAVWCEQYPGTMLHCDVLGCIDVTYRNEAQPCRLATLST